MADVELSKIYLQRFSAVGDGMHLELCQADDLGNIVEEESDPIITIRADSGDDLKFVVYSDSGIVSIPLSEIERAIKVAKEEVHSEDFYN